MLTTYTRYVLGWAASEEFLGGVKHDFLSLSLDPCQHGQNTEIHTTTDYVWVCVTSGPITDLPKSNGWFARGLFGTVRTWF